MTTILEMTSYRAPLALRVSDGATGAAVGDGLIVTIWPAGDPTSLRTARPSPFSALFGFANLPGLRSQEYAKSAETDAPTWPEQATARFVVSVTDSFGRFLPEVFADTAPQPTPVSVTMYSSPARPRLPGWAVVSGEVLTGEGVPASWAWVELSDHTTTYRTVADAAGRFVQYLPYPEALPVLAGDPPVGNGIGDVAWPLTCIVHSQPDALRWPADPAPAGPPDIVSICAQLESPISIGGGPQPSVVATLRYGTPLTLALTVVPA